MTTAQNRSPRFNELFDMEITGFVVFLASTDRADINSEVKRRGDTNIYTRFLRRGTEESDAFTRKIKEAIGEGTRLVYLSRPTVSVFRDLSNIDEARDLTKEETRENQLVKRKLRPNEILFVKGSVRIEIEVPTRGSFV
ncbi:uncharacterized protein N7500_008708 [Penicillium coprophilum]|uniref:uncharacterized protein n=1 Tax=Penicillium coprophilum TaxID=36646 RepID=UPI0023910558|nr:uncharacterized protein N7500_008708 [Penicillium coprophilum]KAJ5159057.1 hypothetical protein N7500_008708 [Penicillium coprophilum]